MDTHKTEILLYETAHGRLPFEAWLEGLKDRKARAIIRARLDRLEAGNAGRCDAVGDGVLELKIHFGAGYRVYFALENRSRAILLFGGDKSTQKQDIKKAREFWRAHKEKR